MENNIIIEHATEFGKVVETKAVKDLVKTLANASECVDENRENFIKVFFELSGVARMRKGHDYEAVQYFSVPWQKIAWVLFSALNKATTNAKLKQFVAEAITWESDKDADKDFKQEAIDAVNEIKGQYTMVKSGPITFTECRFENLIVDFCEDC